MKNLLEEKIRLALENYEEQYNPSDWVVMQRKLDEAASLSFRAKIIKSIILSAMVIGISGSIYFFFSEKNEILPRVSEKQEMNSAKIVEREEKVIPPNENSAAQKQIIIQQSDKNKSGEIAVPCEKSIKEENKVIPVKTITSSLLSGSNTGLIIGPGKASVASFPEPRADFRSDRAIICENNTVQFNIENTDVPCEYRWDFGDNAFSGEANPQHQYKNSGNYSVKLQVVSLLDKKSDIRVMKDMIVVNPVPLAEFTWKTHPENQNIYFESNQNEVVENKWNFGDLQGSSEQNPSHLFNKKGNYNVILSTRNNYGCSNTSQQMVSTERDFNLLAPNAFSPNGDGKNDTWLPVALLNGDFVFALTVLDKNGNIAFKTTAGNNPWNGRHLTTNEMVKAGDAFKWIALVKDKNGLESTHGGVISISESGGY